MQKINIDLLKASVRGDLAEIRRLVSIGADINSDTNRVTPLLSAINNNNNVACDLLLKYGADIEAVDSYGYTAIHLAAMHANIAVLKKLIHLGANINNKSTYGTTPLITAAFTGSLDICAMLLDRGANIDDKDNDGSTALMVAASNGYNSICQIMLKSGADVDMMKAENDSALSFAAANGHAEIVSMLLPMAKNSIAYAKEIAKLFSQAEILKEIEAKSTS